MKKGYILNDGSFIQHNSCTCHYNMNVSIDSQKPAFSTSTTITDANLYRMFEEADEVVDNTTGEQKRQYHLLIKKGIVNYFFYKRGIV